jgi:cytochrome c oxidase cbb3-type subunit I/II
MLLSHFTDWTIAHVHIGGMGWNGFLTFGMLYWLLPKLFRTKLFSNKLANAHFWIATLGMLMYSVPLYWAGFTQTLMWKEFTADGLLAYPNFLETVTQIIPMYMTRVVGGTFYFIGAVLMVYNLVKTVKSGSMVNDEETEAPARVILQSGRMKGEATHRWLERKPVRFAVLSLVAVIIGGAIEIIPLIVVKSNIPSIQSVQPYTPLELEGRDIYVREGCYTCHSQMVRPFRSETERYGEYSKEGEFVYDHPFQWGSKRTGPDLARAGVIGGKMFKSAAWHYNHFMDPTSMSPESIMPKYPWFAKQTLDISDLKKKIEVMQTLGVPYPEGYAEKAEADLIAQAEKIAKELKDAGIEIAADKEMIAVIAYLHRLGKDISVAQEVK